MTCAPAEVASSIRILPQELDEVDMFELKPEELSDCLSIFMCGYPLHRGFIIGLERET